MEGCLYAGVRAPAASGAGMMARDAALCDDARQSRAGVLMALGVDASSLLALRVDASILLALRVDASVSPAGA